MIRTRTRTPPALPSKGELMHCALRAAAAGFFVHPLYATGKPFKGFQTNSTRDPDEIEELFAHPDAAGLGYLIGRGCFVVIERGRTGRIERGRRQLYDLLVVDVDDGQAGLDQLASLTAEIQEEWRTRPDREWVIPAFRDDFADGTAKPLPPTMTITTPSGGLQLVYVTHHLPDSPGIIGHRLASSLELKAASREGAPISGRLPPTFRKAHGAKPAGAYRFKDSRLPTIIPWPWEDRWLETSMSIRGRMTSIGDNPPPSVADDYAKAEAAKVLKRACDQIAATRVGRRMTINNWSLIVGHLAWALHVPQALHALKVAARKSGWRGDIEKTVEDAFHDGAKDPRDVRRSTFGRRRLKGPDDPLIEFGARV